MLDKHLFFPFLLTHHSQSQCLENDAPQVMIDWLEYLLIHKFAPHLPELNICPHVNPSHPELFDLYVQSVEPTEKKCFFPMAIYVKDDMLTTEVTNKLNDLMYTTMDINEDEAIKYYDPCHIRAFPKIYMHYIVNNWHPDLASSQLHPFPEYAHDAYCFFNGYIWMYYACRKKHFKALKLYLTELLKEEVTKPFTLFIKLNDDASFRIEVKCAAKWQSLIIHKLTTLIQSWGIHDLPIVPWTKDLSTQDRIIDIAKQVMTEHHVHFGQCKTDRATSWDEEGKERGVFIQGVHMPEKKSYTTSTQTELKKMSQYLDEKMNQQGIPFETMVNFNQRTQAFTLYISMKMSHRI